MIFLNTYIPYMGLGYWKSMKAEEEDGEEGDVVDDGDQVAGRWCKSSEAAAVWGLPSSPLLPPISLPSVTIQPFHITPVHPNHIYEAIITLNYME